MSDPVEGTVVLDGLIEGRVPDRPEARELLTEWVRAAREARVPFSLSFDGSSFSLLADQTPVAVEDLSPDPAARIAGALEELIKVFPPSDRGSLFSTLRSVEYRKGQAIQTVYGIGADGAVETMERTVEARTGPPRHGPSRRDKVRAGLAGLVVAVGIFLVSSVFVDYRELLSRVAESVTPLNADALKVDTGPFADYFTISKKAVGSGSQTVTLTLKRTASFPLDDEAAQKLLAASADSPSRRLTVEAIVRGYVRVEFFGKDDKFLGFSTQRIAALRRAESAEIVVPIPRDPRPARIAITY